jgi:5-methylcytosine-specific restriction endonuclease McrA
MNMADHEFEFARGECPIPEATRKSVLERAKGRCEDCGVLCDLELHHLHYDTVGQETPGDLAALCRECHEERHIDYNGDFWDDPKEMADYWWYFHEEMSKD